MFIDDTIAALSTPPGKGAISVIRLSGPEAIKIAGMVFKPAAGALEAAASRFASYGKFYADGKIIDDGIAILYRAPASFTGQDVAELSCHGGVLVTRCILEQLFSRGARPAEAGEFTRRAFCLGKLDLSQAEAVALTLDAKNYGALTIGAAQREGVFSHKIKELFNELADIIASVFVYIDYPDESLSDVAPGELSVKIKAIITKLEKLRSSYSTGRAVTEGIPTAICGKPNSGKSSLLNRLLGTERAIVTEIAGTTRDTIEETAVTGGVTLRLSDTAGIHETCDTVEKIGISRTMAAVESAELILAVFDGSSNLDLSDEKVFSLLSGLRDQGKRIIALINKSDLNCLLSEEEIKSRLDIDLAMKISSLTGDGFEMLSDSISALYLDGSLNYSTDAIITGARQYAAVSTSLQRLENALQAIELGMTADVAGFDLEEALGMLGELDGRSVSEEIVESIFHNFCVGK